MVKEFDCLAAMELNHDVAADSELERGNGGDQPGANSDQSTHHLMAEGERSAAGGTESVGAKVTMKKVTKEGLAFKKDESFGQWYSDLVVKGEMLEYYDVSGCYILRPWSYSIWESIKGFLDTEIKQLGVENTYFPLFVSKKAFLKEEDHVEGFAPEVAWVTKSGESDLEEPIAVRPTSETAMYPTFAKWIRSHRDLPLKLNQWCNVVRWEFKHPTPFIRSREFLWQEGHTAFATKAEADGEVHQILELYRRVYEEFLAVPVIKGVKSELEKFAGALYTTSVEAYIPAAGRGVQAATSHGLGQTFARMFDIGFEDGEDKKRKLVWQNSWGLSTRAIGVVVMVHGDNKGLVLPPRVAPVQVIVVPVPFRGLDPSEECLKVTQQLQAAGLRAKADVRGNYKPGWKYSHWELKGVPLRIEIGPTDIEKNQVRVVCRDLDEKAEGRSQDVPVAGLVEKIREMLDTMQNRLLERAREERDSCIVVGHTWDDFTTALNNKKMVLAPWCDEVEVEESVKARTKGESVPLGPVNMAAKTLCMPLEQAALPMVSNTLAEGTKCFASGKPAKKWALWGRSY